MRIAFWVGLLGALTVLAACGGFGGGGGGGDSGGATGPASFRVLDLATGAVTDASTLPDLTAAAATSSQMVFRRVPAGSFTVGQTAGSLGAQSDETPATATLAEYWIAVFEITQGQWIALTGDPVAVPWKQVDPAGVTGSAATLASRPAFGVVYDDLIARLGVWNGGKTPQLRLPSAQEWEYGCRAGTTTLFAWGDSLDPAVAGQFAVCADVTVGVNGPAPVGGSRVSNGLGLWDMHGNVREWVTTANPALPELRGGSWADNLLLSRSANRFTSVDKAYRHALSGARLVLVAP